MAAAVDAVGVFTWMWAQAMVLQVVKLAISASKSPNPLSVEALFWPLTMASATLAGVLWPLRGWVSVYLCLVSLVVLWSTGSQSNHVFMDMVVCMAVLFTFSPDRRRWVGQATHAVRLFLVVLYLVTGLHKMNADWGRAEVSCCTLMLVGILALPPLRWALPMLPLSAAPHAATVVELGLPLLLLAGGPAASRVAAVLGCGFHLAICQMLSPMSVYPFSVLMAPLYVFVVPGQAAELFLAMRRWLPLLVPLFAVLCAVWTPLMAAGDLPDGEAPFEYPAYGSWAPGVVWCNFAYVGLIGAAVCRSSHGDSPAALPTRRGRLHRGVSMRRPHGKRERRGLPWQGLSGAGKEPGRPLRPWRPWAWDVGCVEVRRSRRADSRGCARRESLHRARRVGRRPGLPVRRGLLSV